MALEKAKDIFKAHFQRASAHHAALAESHGSAAESHRVYSERHASKDGAAFHKSLSLHHSRCAKAHSAYSTHLGAMAEGVDEGHADKIASAIGLTPVSGEAMFEQVYDAPIKTFAIPRTSGNGSGSGKSAGPIDLEGVDYELQDLVKTEI